MCPIASYAENKTIWGDFDQIAVCIPTIFFCIFQFFFALEYKIDYNDYFIFFLIL
jgi:hypothetical protein